MALIDQLFGSAAGGLGTFIKDTVGAFKLDPEKKAEFQAAVDANTAAIEQKKMDLQGKLDDAISSEVKISADIIKTEAQSQSWLPRNVRPLLLMMWGTLITLNYLIPLITSVFKVAVAPIPLDPWIYKMTVIGYTGYATLRSVEKIKDSDG